MPNALRIGAVGMMVNKFRGAVAANNTANVNTTGYKKRRVLLSEVNLRSSRILRRNRAGAVYSPVVSSRSGGVKVKGISRINTQGTIYQSGNQADMAILGEGFFQVVMPKGKAAYTRNGAFKISPEGMLVTSDGYNLQSSITIPPDALNVIIGSDGRVQAQRQGETEPVFLGQIEIARFQNPTGLKSIGSNLYEQTHSSGEPITGIPGEEGFGKIIQGSLEGSNVDLAEEQIILIMDQRAFQASANIVKTADQMMKTIIDIKK